MLNKKGSIKKAKETCYGLSADSPAQTVWADWAPHHAEGLVDPNFDLQKMSNQKI
jgi:hypothetical protein